MITDSIFVCFENYSTDLTTLELVSTTEQACIWKKNKEPVLEQFQPVPVDEFDCIVPDRLPRFSHNVLVDLRKELIQCKSSTVIPKSW